MSFFNKKQSGLTLIEALVSTAIVGIGFVAIFQMVNFSVQSINTSGERTKANYLVSMIAEDIIGYRNTERGIAMLHSVMSILIRKMVGIKHYETSVKISEPTHRVHNPNDQASSSIYTAKI